MRASSVDVSNMSDSLESTSDCNKALALLNRDLVGVLGPDVRSGLQHHDDDTSSVGGSSFFSGGEAIVDAG